jgi:hypothetical protein
MSLLAAPPSQETLGDMRKEMAVRDERHARELLQLRQKVDRMQTFVHGMHLAGMVQAHEGNLYFKATVGSDSVVQQQNVAEQQRRAAGGSAPAPPPAAAAAAAPAAPAGPPSAEELERQKRQREWLASQQASLKQEADAKAASTLPRIPDPWELKAPKARSFIGQSLSDAQQQQADAASQAAAARQQEAIDYQRSQEEAAAAQRRKEEEQEAALEARLAEEKAAREKLDAERAAKKAAVDKKTAEAMKAMLGGADEGGLFDGDDEGGAGAQEATADHSRSHSGDLFAGEDPAVLAKAAADGPSDNLFDLDGDSGEQQSF